MAPAIDGRDGRTVIRRYRSVREVEFVLPPWTRGDDGDEEVETQIEVKRQKRQFRSRHRARQEDDTTTAPIYSGPFGPRPSTTGPDFSIETGNVPGNGFRSPPPPPPDDSFSEDSPETGPDDSGDSTGSEPPSDGDDSEPEDETTMPPGPTPTEAVAEITTEPLPALTSGATATSGTLEPDPTADAAQRAQAQHHKQVQTALIVVGAIAGFVCLAVGGWLIWRLIQRRRNPPPPPTGPQPSRRERFLARVPYLKSRFGQDRSWQNIDESYADEKTAAGGMNGYDLLGYIPDKPAPAAAPPLPKLRFQGVDSNGTYIDTTLRSSQTQDSNYQTISPVSQEQQMPYSPTESSLSSAFGNGTFIPPTPLHPPPPHAEQQRRDTVYTESSEASSVPRFRTINSWVRQQTSRVRKPVPEQGFGMMMPDDEEPKRVVVAPRGVGFAK